MCPDEKQASEMFKGILKASADAIGQRSKEAAGALGQKSKEALEYLGKPENLAEVVIKATAAQEAVNTYLKTRNSVYRIGELQITAGLPPQVTFSVVRGEEDGLDSTTLASDSQSRPEE